MNSDFYFKRTFISGGKTSADRQSTQRFGGLTVELTQQNLQFYFLWFPLWKISTYDIEKILVFEHKAFSKEIRIYEKSGKYYFIYTHPKEDLAQACDMLNIKLSFFAEASTLGDLHEFDINPDPQWQTKMAKFANTSYGLLVIIIGNVLFWLMIFGILWFMDYVPQ